MTKIKNLKLNSKEDINLRRSFYVDSLKKGEGGGGWGRNKKTYFVVRITKF